MVSRSRKSARRLWPVRGQRRLLWCRAGESPGVAEDFLKFVEGTGSPAHTVFVARQRLEKAGFKELAEGEPWALERGGRYFVTSQGTSVCAFVVGGKFDATKGGVVMAAAHTDSPCLKLRPSSKVPAKAGTVQLGVDTYGGGLWHTWFDRPLGLAGKLLIGTGSGMYERLVHIPEPLCVIPNLAIHLTTAEERKAFTFNKETQLRPVICGTLPSREAPAGDADSNGDKKEKESGERHHHTLLGVVAKAAGVQPEEILDIDLCLMDASPPCVLGDYVCTPRIDNVLSTWAAFEGLLAFAESGAAESSCDVCVAASFDHEEVGSTSAAGADSAVLERWLLRALEALGTPAATWPEVASRSFLLSCDCAHGLHPNYAEKHQAEHAPLLGKGIVIKTNANQRYATTPLLAQMVREVCKREEVPVQEFVVRNDCPCGSTIGPLLSALLGVRTVDVGAPQWAMHSIRETAHAADVVSMRGLCTGLFRHFREVDRCTETV